MILGAINFASLNLDHQYLNAGDFVCLIAGLFYNGLFSCFFIIVCYEGEDYTRLEFSATILQLLAYNFRHCYAFNAEDGYFVMFFKQLAILRVIYSLYLLGFRVPT